MSAVDIENVFVLLGSRRGILGGNPGGGKGGSERELPEPSGLQSSIVLKEIKLIFSYISKESTHVRINENLLNRKTSQGGLCLRSSTCAGA